MTPKAFRQLQTGWGLEAEVSVKTTRYKGTQRLRGLTSC